MITLNIDVTMLGPILCTIAIILGLASCLLSFKIENGGMGLYLLGVGMILIGIVLNDTLTPSKQDRYSECLADNYTVFLNGEEVSYPDKLNVKGYKISFDDKNKEVRLSD